MTSKFSTMITHLRKQRGISQKTAAAELGVSQSLLSHYEKGIRECGNDFIVKAADYYGVSCDYILGRQQSAQSENTINAPEHSEHSLATAFRACGCVLDRIRLTDPTYSNRLCSFITLSVYRSLASGISAGYIPKSWCPAASKSDPAFFEHALCAVSDGLLTPIRGRISVPDEATPQSVKTVCEKSESCIKYYLQQLDDNI